MDKAKAMIEADPNRSYIVDVFEAGSNQKVSFNSHRPRGYPAGEGGRGVTWVNFCWVCAAGLSEPLPHYSLFRGQL